MEKSEKKYSLAVKGLSVLKTSYNNTGFYCKIIRDSDSALLKNFNEYPIKGIKKFISLCNEVLDVDGIDWELADKESMEHPRLLNKIHDFLEKKDGYLQVRQLPKGEIDTEPTPEPKKEQEFQYFVFDESAIKNMHIKTWIKENCLRITHGYKDKFLGDIVCEKIVVEFPDFIRTLEVCEKYDSFEELKQNI